MLVPLALFAPLQLPLAVQLVGLLVADQLSVELAPVPIAVGLKLIDTTGGLEALPDAAVTLVLAVPVPPALTHDSV